MRLLSSLQSNIGDGLKALRVNYGALGGNDFPMGRGTQNWWAHVTPGTDLDYAALVGDVWHNSAVQAVLNWIIRAWPQSRPCVKEIIDGEEIIVSHPIDDLLLNPNPYYDDTVLWAGIILSLWSFGSAYVKIVRNRGGTPAELYYLPHKWVYPIRDFDSRRLVDSYRYTPTNAKGEVFNPDDVLHFRFGINPDDPRFGIGAWDSCLREINIDNEAGNYESAAMMNGGALSWLLSQADTNVELSEEQIKRAIELLRSKSTRDQRGGFAYLDGNIKAQQMSTDPDKMALEAIRRIPETRITACAGIPAITVGLAAGLERSTFENTTQAETSAWRTIEQVQRMISRQLTRQLLTPRNYKDVLTRPVMASFDYANVPALQPDRSQETEQWGQAYQVYKFATLNEARQGMGLCRVEDLDPDEQEELASRNVPPPTPEELAKAKADAMPNDNAPPTGKN